MALTLFFHIINFFQTTSLFLPEEQSSTNFQNIHINSPYLIKCTTNQIHYWDITMRLLRNLKFNYFSQQIKSFRSKYLQDDYQIMGFLGQGSTSRVFLGSNILTNQKVVIKIFKPIPQEKIHRQVRVNNKINSYCEQFNNKQIPILQLLDVVKDRGCGSYALIFQYFPGSPMHMTPVAVLKQNRFRYMEEILNALKIVHSVGLIHRDLKPSNILVTTHGAKLFDFGLSKEVGVDELKTNRFGTKCYYPPQVIFRMPQYDQKLDIWTCGLIFSQLLTMIKPILPYKSDLQTLQQVINFCDYEQKVDKQVIKEDFLNLIKQKTHSRSFQGIMGNLRRNKQILPQLSNQHMNLLTSTVGRMLKINPSMRPSAEEVLEILQPVFNIYK